MAYMGTIWTRYTLACYTGSNPTVSKRDTGSLRNGSIASIGSLMSYVELLSQPYRNYGSTPLFLSACIRTKIPPSSIETSTW